MPIIGGRGAGVRGLGFQGAGRPSQVTGLTVFVGIIRKVIFIIKL